jgi:hypothetical protein
VAVERPFPYPQADAIVANITGTLTPRTRLAVVDHITSGSAIVLPLQRIVADATTRAFPCWSMARNIALAVDATSLPARRLNTEPGATSELAGSAGVRLLLAGVATAEQSQAVRTRLLEAGTDAPTHV